MDVGYHKADAGRRTRKPLRTLLKVMKPLLPIFFQPNSNLLEELGIIMKTKRPDNKKTNLYLLTEKGWL
jgi:hypothetical protein